LPIDQADGRRLCEIGAQSPFGLGERTIVNKTVRSTRQIEPGAIKLHNPAFEQWLNGTMLPDLKQSMGIDTKLVLKLSLYKLLIYQEGDHFLPHKDTPKEDGMVGTVALVLPSDWKGGTIVVEHGSKKKEIDFSEDCKFNTGVAAW